MIEFFGEPSEICQKVTDIKSNNVMFFFFLFLDALFFGMGSVFLAFDIMDNLWQLCAIGCLVLTMLLPVIKFMRPRKYMREFRYNVKIVFDNYKAIRTQYAGKTEIVTVKLLSNIKKVINADEWYYIIFKYGAIDGAWVCQKDLIIKRTLEEFEQLFKGKLQKKKNPK